MRVYFLIVITTISLTAFTRQIKPDAQYGGAPINRLAQTDSGIIISHYNNVCKNIFGVKQFVVTKVSVKQDTGRSLNSILSARKVKLLTIHGNVSYDFVYRSKSDTPVLQENFNQHTERVYLNILLQEKYPFKVAVVLRQSNSPYFKNFNDIGFQFDKSNYYKTLKQSIINKLPAYPDKIPGSNALRDIIKQTEQKFLNTKGWLESPATLQKIIEERERDYAKKMPDTGAADQSIVVPDIPHFNRKLLKKQFENEQQFDGIKDRADSITAPFATLYQHKKDELDSLSAQLKLLHKKSDSIKENVQRNFTSVRQKIYKAGNEKELRKIAADNGIEVSPQNKLESKLAAITNFSLGRSLVNYTELTAQNITITGVNIEYNPSYYAAFAAGKINYRFRDFLNKDAGSNGQYLALGRIGIGSPGKSALILTVFKGRKNSSGYALNDSITNHINIIGYSLESIFKKNENTSISFEVAKSTKPITGNLQNNKQINVLWKFNDQTNFGINIKAQTIIAETNTRLSGFFRKTGENFQSFSLFSYHTDQTAWLARADQSFFTQKATLTAMLRRNDFTNPFTEKTFKTSTVFKSLLLNIRVPKYPSLSLGYYPGSQLYVVNKEIIRENVYYLFNGSLVHSYSYKGTRMNSSLVYNHYFNKATDSGFVLYKGTGYFGVQTVFLKKLQLQTSGSYNSQPELKYVTVETSGDYALKQFLKIGIGAKYNKINGGNYYWGQRIQLAVDFKQPGRLQLQYEKSYLPGINQTLYPVEIGRISWYKYF